MGWGSREAGTNAHAGVGPFSHTGMPRCPVVSGHGSRRLLAAKENTTPTKEAEVVLRDPEPNRVVPGTPRTADAGGQGREPRPAGAGGPPDGRPPDRERATEDGGAPPTNARLMATD